MLRQSTYKFNKRAYQRYPCVVVVKIIVGDDQFEGTALNIGFGGMLLCAPQLKIAVNSKVTLRFRLPNMDNDIDVISYVRWSRENTFGMQFDSIFDQSVLVDFFEIFSLCETLNIPQSNLKIN